MLLLYIVDRVVTFMNNFESFSFLVEQWRDDFICFNFLRWIKGLHDFEISKEKRWKLMELLIFLLNPSDVLLNIQLHGTKNE